jgi:hypothetical protein
VAGFFVSLSRLRVVFFFACESNRVSLKVIFVPRKKKKKREKNFKKVQKGGGGGFFFFKFYSKFWREKRKVEVKNLTQKSSFVSRSFKYTSPLLLIGSIGARARAKGHTGETTRSPVALCLFFFFFFFFFFYR